MTETTLQQIQGATSDVQRTWIITEAILSSFPSVLQQAILAAGVPHWFNAVVLAGLLEIDTSDSENLLQVIQNLSFSEPFGQTNYALHDLTRAAILWHLRNQQASQLQLFNERAYQYFSTVSDTHYQLEAIYHLWQVDAEAGFLRFKDEMRNFRNASDFGSANTLLRYIQELADVGLLSTQAVANLDRQIYWTGRRRAKLGQNEQDPGRAEAHFREALRLWGDSVEGMPNTQAISRPLDFKQHIEQKNQAYLEQKLGDARQAEDVIRQGIWLTELGNFHTEKEAWQTALDSHHQAIQLNPTDAKAIASRGETHRLMGNYEAALADFDRAIELDEKYDWAIASRGQTYGAMGNYEAALAD
ncbi:MAG: tetratricopeptide repeat protein, partial [Anaerolinea sp.]|nr:tetratricopeptide repeat protein [Anaerolinea sp.]